MKLILLVAVLFHTISAQAKCHECGAWFLSRSDGSGSFLEIKRENNIFYFDLHVQSGGDTPNQGDIAGTLKIIDKMAIFKDEATECELKFVFSNRIIKIESINRKTFSCGFSNGVLADGVYRK